LQSLFLKILFNYQPLYLALIIEFFFEDQFCKVIKLNWKIIKLYLKIKYPL
jgi:hypothetical protein